MAIGAKIWVLKYSQWINFVSKLFSSGDIFTMQYLKRKSLMNWEQKVLCHDWLFPAISSNYAYINAFDDKGREDFMLKSL